MAWSGIPKQTTVWKLSLKWLDGVSGFTHTPTVSWVRAVLKGAEEADCQLMTRLGEESPEALSTGTLGKLSEC